MRLLYVAEDDYYLNVLEYHLLPMGIDTFHYRHPLKAMDNLREIKPDYVLFSATDFPRHWKLLLSLLRETKSKDEAIFCLLATPDFPLEEADKAVFLGANAIFKDDLDKRESTAKLVDLICRYKNPDNARRQKRFIPKVTDYIHFIFANPANFEVITGQVQDLSETGLSFLPDAPSSTSMLEEDLLIEQCSLKLGKEILFIDVKIIRNSKIMAFSFPNIQEKEQDIIKNYIKESSLRLIEKAKETSDS